MNPPKENEYPTQTSDASSGKALDNRSLFDPTYLAEVYAEFYRELAKAYAGFMNGFRKYK